MAKFKVGFENGKVAKVEKSLTEAQFMNELREWYRENEFNWLNNNLQDSILWNAPIEEHYSGFSLSRLASEKGMFDFCESIIDTLIDEEKKEIKLSHDVTIHDAFAYSINEDKQYKHILELMYTNYKKLEYTYGGYYESEKVNRWYENKLAEFEDTLIEFTEVLSSIYKALESDIYDTKDSDILQYAIDIGYVEVL